MDANAIAQRIVVYPDAVELDLTNSSLSSRQFPHITRQLEDRGGNIRSLILSGNNVGKDIHQFCTFIGHSENLANVDFSTSNLTSISALAAALQKNTSVQSLNLGGNPAAFSTSHLNTEDGLAILAPSLALHPSLQRLSLQKNAFSSSSSAKLLSCILSPSLHPFAFASTGLSLPLSPPPLRVLNLSYNSLCDEGLKVLSDAVAGNQTLQSLLLASNKITPLGLLHILEAARASPSLESLALGYNHLRAEGAAILYEYLKGENLPRLKVLDLQQCELGCEGVELLSPALLTNKSLIKLNISANNMRDKGCKALATALASNQTLKHLYIAGNNISGPNGGTALSSLVSAASHLLSLHMEFNGLGAEGFKSFFKNFSASTPLRTLNVAGNQMSLFSKSLSKFLKGNQNLVNLGLDDNDIPLEGGNDVLELVKSNPQLKQVSIQQNIMISADVISQISAHLSSRSQKPAAGASSSNAAAAAASAGAPMAPSSIPAQFVTLSNASMSLLSPPSLNNRGPSPLRAIPPIPGLSLSSAGGLLDASSASSSSSASRSRSKSPRVSPRLDPSSSSSSSSSGAEKRLSVDIQSDLMSQLGQEQQQQPQAAAASKSSLQPGSASPRPKSPSADPDGASSPSWEIKWEDLKVEETPFAQGAFGEVYRGDYFGTKVAVKKLRISARAQAKLVEEFKAEIDILRKLRHPNLCLFLGASLVPPNLAIVLEYMEGGSLFDLLTNRRSLVASHESKVAIARSVAAAMNYLHHRNPPLVHRDLKSLNILIGKTHAAGAEFEVKVTDFGLTRVRDEAAACVETQNCAGTPIYMAPEVLMENRVTEKCDTFAFAIVLYEIWIGVPWMNMNPMQITLKTSKGMRPPLPEEEAKMPASVRTLIQDCWVQDPALRPSFDDIVLRLKHL